jgi:hypothetical protein
LTLLTINVHLLAHSRAMARQIYGSIHLQSHAQNNKNYI